MHNLATMEQNRKLDKLINEKLREYLIGLIVDFMNFIFRKFTPYNLFYFTFLQKI